MRNMSVTVVVIGGGATGVGILRDLSMRGARAVLLEQSETVRAKKILHLGQGEIIAQGLPNVRRQALGGLGGQFGMCSKSI